jgi:hypothetical protein
MGSGSESASADDWNGGEDGRGEKGGQGGAGEAGSGDGTDGNYLTPQQIASASATPHLFNG